MKPETTKKTPKCRILYLVGQLGPGGLERQLVSILETIDKQRYLPVVVVWNFNDKDIYVDPIRALGVEILSLSGTYGSIGKLLSFGLLARKLDPEVIHSYSFFTNFAAYWGKILTRAVAIGALQSDFLTEKKVSGMFLGRLSSRWPEVHISNNFLAAENVKSTRSLFVPQKLFIVRNGLDLTKFQKKDFAHHRKPIILAIGSLLPVKRWDRLIKAVFNLKEAGQNFVLKIVGEGPMRSSLEKQAEAFQLGGWIEFLGYRKDIPALLADSQFLVHTSDREGCPNAITEAMACGRAVIATNVGDVPYLVEEGKTGFVVEPQDIAALTVKMNTLMKNVELSRQMGNAGRLKAEREFGLDRLIGETLAVYRAAGWSDK